MKAKATEGAGRQARPDDEISPEVAEMLAGMDSFIKAIEAGESIERWFGPRTYRRSFEAREYDAAAIRAARKAVGANRTLFASFLGVRPGTVQAWERGVRPVPLIVRRFLDVLADNPDSFGRGLLVEVKPPEAG